MGLNKATARAWLVRWYVPAGMVAIALVIGLFGDSGREWFSYSRPDLAHGEIWRLASGHFAHLGLSHLLLNVAGLLLVWILVGDAFSSLDWILVSLACLAGIDLGLWFLDRQLVSYVGLSGLLHGILAAGIVQELPARRFDIRVLAVILLGKLLYEQFAGPLPGSEEASGGAVIVNAHAYGAAAGLVAGIITSVRVRRRAPI